jgi:hypothetical protein
MNIWVSLYHKEPNKLRKCVTLAYWPSVKLFFILILNTEPLLFCSNLQKFTIRAMYRLIRHSFPFLITQSNYNVAELFDAAQLRIPKECPDVSRQCIHNHCMHRLDWTTAAEQLVHLLPDDRAGVAASAGMWADTFSKHIRSEVSHNMVLFWAFNKCIASWTHYIQLSNFSNTAKTSI